MVGFLGRDDRCVAAQHEVDPRVWHQVCLELRDVNIQGTVETERRSERRDDLSDEAVQVRVRGALNVQVAAANIVEGLIVDQHGDISMLKQGVQICSPMPWPNLGRPLQQNSRKSKRQHRGRYRASICLCRSCQTMLGPRTPMFDP